MAKRIIRLTETELINLVKKVVKEQAPVPAQTQQDPNKGPGEMEEGWFGDLGKGIRKFATGHESSESKEAKKEKLMDDLDYITSLAEEHPDNFFMGEEWDRFVRRTKEMMEENNYRGYFTIDQIELDDPKLDNYLEKYLGKKGYELIAMYNKGLTKAQMIGSGAAGGVRSGYSKTMSNESRLRRNRLR
jgi:hypothetical protein